MSVSNIKELAAHIGHDIECVAYTNGTVVCNVALECRDCNEVLLDFDNDIDEEDWGDTFYIVENIEWDLDGFSEKDKKRIVLPSKAIIPASIELRHVADYLSDEYGFCVLSFNKKEK